MELAIIIALLIALIALFASRIHFHFSFNLTISRDSKFNSRLKTPPMGSREAKRWGCATFAPQGLKAKAPAVRSIKDSSVTKALESARLSAEVDLCSALVNLGCGKLKALEIAKRAMIEGGRDFDSRLKWALQKAA